MGDLISRKEAVSIISEYMNCEHIAKRIKNLPTACNVEAILTKIEHIRKDEAIRYADQAINACINAVKAGGRDE